MYNSNLGFKWEGRELKTAVADDTNLSYTYNSDGIRTSKTVDGAATTYFLDGSTIMAQKSGSDVMWFVYDSDGTRVGFTYNGATYHYLTNALGDVTGITDIDDNLVVEYSYDVWGKLLNVADSSGDAHIGQKNPFIADITMIPRLGCITSIADTTIRRPGDLLMRTRLTCWKLTKAVLSRTTFLLIA